MKYPIIIFLLINSVLISQVPIDYKFSSNNTLDRYENITEEGLNSNAIVDIRPLDSNYFLLSTASGLSYAYFNDVTPESIKFASFNKDSIPLPRGGAPALAVRENIIAISGILDTTAATGEEIMGTGISYSIDEGEIWQYLQQPRENPDSDKYHTISWGGQTISALSVTTEINNISYDLSIGGDYIYAASWAGGLRRYGPLYTGQKSWQIIPLPMDTDTSLMCGLIDLNIYEINPKDPWKGNPDDYDSTPGTYGNHNHKGFSVYVIDNTISGGRVVRFEYDGEDIYSIIDRIGQSPLPPYIKRAAEPSDKMRYQTVYADRRGAVAAPTAGLHFTNGLIKRLKDKEVKIEYTTLHIGLGTFRPVQVEDLNRHQMDSEYFELSPKTALAINEAKKKKRKIVAVGTSAVRSLETVVVSGFQVTSKRGWTDKFIYPPYDFKMVDALITNFHQPKSTLLMMVSAFATRKFIMKAYREAKKHDYRFLSYGDAMLVL